MLVLRNAPEEQDKEILSLRELLVEQKKVFTELRNKYVEPFAQVFQGIFGKGSGLVISSFGVGNFADAVVLVLQRKEEEKKEEASTYPAISMPFIANWVKETQKNFNTPEGLNFVALQEKNEVLGRGIEYLTVKLKHLLRKHCGARMLVSISRDTISIFPSQEGDTEVLGFDLQRTKVHLSDKSSVDRRAILDSWEFLSSLKTLGREISYSKFPEEIGTLVEEIYFFGATPLTSLKAMELLIEGVRLSPANLQKVLDCAVQRVVEVLPRGVFLGKGEWELQEVENSNSNCFSLKEVGYKGAPIILLRPSTESFLLGVRSMSFLELEDYGDYASSIYGDYTSEILKAFDLTKDN